VSEAPTPRAFFTERLPAQFAAALHEQEQAAQAAARLLDGMRAVHATIRAEVRGEGGGVFFLNVEAGRVTPAEVPARPPFLTLIQERASFGFLGALSGLAQEMRLTQARIDSLVGIAGTVRFEVRGPDGFALLVHFGPGEPAPTPTTSIAVDRDAYLDLRAGRLSPPDAVMSGRIQLEGDLQLAMQLALAAMSPD
jgi:hypothetical protein